MGMYCDYKLESLAELFSRRTAEKRDDPFTEDMVVTQSGPTQLYLNKSLADSASVAANIEYPYPRKAVAKILGESRGELFSEAFLPEVMTWRIYGLMPYLEENYRVISSYIGDKEDSGLKRYQLSRKIAEVFDIYLGYRGDWLETWQAGGKVGKQWGSGKPLSLGEHETWQADLWRKLTVESASQLVFERPGRLLKAKIADIAAGGLPRRIALFGLSNLPPDFIEFFAILREHIDLDFYYLMPCLEHWEYATRRNAFLEKTENPLLASWGALGRDFFKLLLEYFGDETGGDLPVAGPVSPEISLLNALQQDILHDVPEEESVLKGFEAGKIAEDGSLVINSCFSRMREVEILHDHILSLLNDKGLGFADILVMAPDIEEYVPYIQAVFGSSRESGSSGLPDIPFAIGDCAPAKSSVEAETFIKILDLAGGRLCAQDVYELISSSPLARKFGFSQDDLLKMHDFILNTKIAWGVDAKHKSDRAGLDCPDLNTWEFGFRRLLSGYAFDCESVIDDGTLPFVLDGGEGLLLGEFLELCRLIFDYSELLGKNHGTGEWQEILLAAVNDFLQVPASRNEELEPVYSAITRVFECWRHAGLGVELCPEIVFSALKDELGKDGGGTAAFFRGKVTFCGFLPMRSIPSKAICLLGLNEGEFPRRDGRLGFDLACKDPRPGDRSPGRDDRHIFLETVLACREKLYLSYIGQSISDNEDIPPSILISELVDYLSATSGAEPMAFITEHPLHGFDVRYFSADSKLGSFSPANFQAARSMLSKESGEKFLCPEALQLKERELSFSFDDFAAFFACPAKFFMRQRLRASFFNEEMETLRTCEPLVPDNLEKYIVRNEFLNHILIGKGFDLAKAKKAEGGIPFGVRGDKLIKDSISIAGMVAGAVKKLGHRREPERVYHLELDVNGISLELWGRFGNMYESSQAFYRPGKLRVKEHIQAWIWHQLALASNVEFRDTVLIGCDEKTTDKMKIETGADCMGALAEIFLRGLAKPLPLFLNSSYEFAAAAGSPEDFTDESILRFISENGEEMETCLKKASSKWNKGYEDFGYYDLAEEENFVCFGETPPPLRPEFKDEFIELALKVYGRMARELG